MGFLSTNCDYRPNNLVSIFLVFLLFHSTTPALAAQIKSYIVYLGSPSGDKHYDLAANRQALTTSHLDLLSSCLRRNARADDVLQYSYNKVFNGFAALLHEEEAKRLTKHPDVISVFESRMKKLHTTRSWEFLGLKHNEVNIPGNSIWHKAKFGEDVIIANLDTGVWPESKSFSDEGFGPIPEKYKGICQNQHDPTFHCNRKLIGARYFYKGFAEHMHDLNMTFNSTKSPRDDDHHGSHTLSTAGGNAVPVVNIDGFGNGTAIGGSPKARVAAYKVCWRPSPDLRGCLESDILAGFEAAIDDNVDIISLSIGGNPLDYLEDPVSLASFHAVKHGIPVIASAGNNGSKPGTVTNVAPWIFTVGASTIDRQYVNHVMLGNNHTLKGASRSHKALPANSFYPLITGASAALPDTNSSEASFCKKGKVDPEKVKGKILVCLRGEGHPLDKGYEAKSLGAVGMIVANTEEFGIEIEGEDQPLPASHLTFSDGQALLSYLDSTESPVATITSPSTKLGVKPAPFMASFSSRGPNAVTPGILKPDIIAPGVGIIAAKGGDNEYGPFDGTSMSCPHITGTIGLLKSIYPHWSPSAIKSAIMTTASQLDNTGKPLLDFTNVEATPFDYGAGHVRPNRAMDPGLVYDMDHHDYLDFLCAIGYNKTVIKKFSKHSYDCPSSASVANLNYPSITILDFSGNATVSRRVKNVGPPSSTYTATVEAPTGVSITVEPKTLRFTQKGQELEYKLVFAAKRSDLPRDYSFGYLVWSDGKHRVRSPIVVKAKGSKSY